ncbi:MAG: ubiquitin-activating E1 FCCH domain-containing protein [Alphaproteobacteria bacterium]|nr:ubiquitin-activating E1 FCCH domain-containing protein [Alphaproteobacteria bacterium]
MTAKRSHFRLSLAKFAADTRGNVAMIWALTALGVLSFVGIAMDFSNANAAKQVLQNAADSASLVAERMADKPLAERQAAAEQYFRASLADYPYGASATVQVEPMSGGGHKVTASMPAATNLSRLISNQGLVVEASSEAKQEGSDLEVSVVLDVTGSMGGQRITDLKAAAVDLVDIVVRDQQEPYYSKVGLVPYSIGVNLGADAAAARGPITGPSDITNATWRDGPTKAITVAARTNPVMISSPGHGFANGDYLRITGVVGMTQLNNRIFQVANATPGNFQLAGVNGTGFSNYTSGGTMQKCYSSTCGVQVTANNHGLADNGYVFISGVAGMTQLNNVRANSATATPPNAWLVTNVTTNTFVLPATTGPSYGTYTSGGQAFCTVAGCEYLRFTNASNAVRVHRISTCVSERVGAQAYTGVSPATAWVGRNYASTANPCPAAVVTPMTDDKAALRSQINAYTVTGSTSGQIGIAWGWYMLSPSFGNLWPADSRPKPYGSANLKKIAVLMTDGEFNTPYCNGVIAANAGSGSGSAADHINCNATNGNPFDQARSLCTAMKNAGVTVYTVGFGLSNGSQASDVMEECASGSENAFNAQNGTELRAAFRSIATAISLLRLSK